MIETLIAENNGDAWLGELDVGEPSGTPLPALERPRESQRESWEKTDRPLHLSAPPRALTAAWNKSSAAAAERTLARARWMLEHDVHTEFLDGGIGCCWFARQGDDEPVCGETEHAALERLAEQNGLPWENSIHGA
ncbi:MAG: hypothetical protein ABIZ04_08040 [Opitutus sp.]